MLLAHSAHRSFCWISNAEMENVCEPDARRRLCTL